MNENTIQELRGRLRGELITPVDPTYKAARKGYNGMIDRRPAQVARYRDAADVMAGVAFAREHELPLAVRDGAHSGPGLGTSDGGLVLGFRRPSMRADELASVARVRSTRIQQRSQGMTGKIPSQPHAMGSARRATMRRGVAA